MFIQFSANLLVNQIDLKYLQLSAYCYLHLAFISFNLLPV